MSENLSAIKTTPPLLLPATRGEVSILEHNPSFPMAKDNSKKILVVDDDKNIRTLISQILILEGYQVAEAEDGVEALELLEESASDYSTVLLDLQMPRMGGKEALAVIRSKYPSLQCLIISAVGAIKDAVSAMSEGAFWFVQKPFEPEELLALVDRAVELGALKNENKNLKQIISKVSLPSTFIGNSKATEKIIASIKKIAHLDSSVLIRGESGTGKSTLARMLHQSSSRSEKPFVAISCAALPRDLLEAELFGYEKGAFTGAISSRAGKVEAADGGTLFLDEIGDMPLDLQPKLLTFLQDRVFQRIGSNSDRKVDIRVIAATHQDLEEMCQERKFREDLFYRINVLAIDIPSLAERPEDIRPLVEQILKRIAVQHGVDRFELSSEALHKLKFHSWPGNVRELENVMERAAAFSDGEKIDAGDINLGRGSITENGKELARTSTSLVGMTLEDIERRAIIETLEHCEGNRNQAAELLGVSLKSVYNKVKKFGIDI